MSRPALLFYCQHSMGMGHLVRAYALAEGLTAHFDVHLITGGDLPAVPALPAGVNLVALPPLGMDADGQLTETDPHALERIRQARCARVITTCARLRPACVLVELFPFGRKKFAFEVLPLLELARALPPATGDAPRARVLCSVRDLLVTDRRDQQAHDMRALGQLNTLFDGVLVHADPSLARLEDSFAPYAQLQVPVHYTGFVTRAAGSRSGTRQPRLIVSVGGGKVGEPLLRTAVDAAAEVHARFGLRTHIVAGPLAPEDVWARLQAAARVEPSVSCVRYTADLAGDIAASAVSVSQCGYNTMMDVLSTAVPAVVVPYSAGRENEQAMRAERLAALGRVHVLPEDDLDTSHWITAVNAAIAGRARAPAATGHRLDMNGVEASCRWILAHVDGEYARLEGRSGASGRDEGTPDVRVPAHTGTHPPQPMGSHEPSEQKEGALPC